MKTHLLLPLLFLLFSCGGPETINNDAPQPFAAQDLFPDPPRPEGQQDVIELACEPIDTVRIGIIGLGMRGSGAVYRQTFLEHSKVVALCDVVPENVARSQQMLAERGQPPAAEYTGVDDWKKVCEREDIDLIYICTHWDLHTPIAVYAMEQGKHVATEVPAALTIDECWQLVNTAEKTMNKALMMLLADIAQ